MARGHLEKRNQAQKTLSFIGKPENRTRTGFAPTTSMGKFYDKEAIPKFDRLDAAVNIWLNKDTRNKHITKEVENAEKDFVPAYRTIYAYLRGNIIDVTDDDLISMGLPTRPTGSNTPSPVETESPALEIDTSTSGQLTVHFYPKGKKRNAAKPDGQRGCEIRHGILKTQPVDPDELPISDFDTNSPFIIKTKGENKGDFFYCSVRWENTRGEKGPWSAITMAVVV
jgi:hypothetical protein